MKKVYTAILTGLVLELSDGLSQPAQYNLQTAIAVGKIIKNHPGYPDINNPAVILELQAGKKLSGSKNWHRYYRYGENSLLLSFGSLGNKQVLGNFFALTPQLSVPLIEQNKLMTSFTLGLGVCWFQKPYNRITNAENIMVGSKLNFCGIASFNLSYQLSSEWQVSLAPKIYHSSNSHSNLPNAGMNLPLLAYGIKYTIHKDEPPDSIVPGITHFNKQIRFSIRSGIAYNQFGGTTAPAGPHYPIYLLSFFVTKQLSPINKLQSGLEGWYNTGVYDFIVSQDFYSENQRIKSYSLNWFIGHEFLLGHVSLLTQGGIYLYHPFFRDKLSRQSSYTLKEKLKTIFPARIGLQYYLYDETERMTNNLFIGIYIKTNLGQADFLDTGIGYRF
ncbi:MAG: acyloxyacyl hydrolase [Bacteroidia bacterium]|nr:acyloxyacyl hydrolase [Bacteroidia bacterium]MCZ2277093.1 acyloxyacyl hydrolase [Bacteroidia bacterium]